MRRSGLPFIVVFVMSLIVLCSCGDMDSDVPLFYIKNGTEAYDPAEEMIDNFYSTFYDESEPDEADVTETVQVSESEAYVETADASESDDTEEHIGDGTVYWVKSGEVWHKTDKCPSLSRSKNIRSGSIEDAMLAGKSRACKKCGT